MNDHPDPRLIPPLLRAQLRANAEAGGGDHVPVLKLFNPIGAGTWLLTELARDNDTAFGLCDLDTGCPELGSVSIRELLALKLPLGLSIERDAAFQSRLPVSCWAKIACRAGSIRDAEAQVARLPDDTAGAALPDAH